MNIVTNSVILDKIATIDVFESSEKTVPNSNKIKLKIRDEFTIKYKALSMRDALKKGNIGHISFYEDNELDENEIYVFNGDGVIGIEFTEEDKQIEIRQYLNDLLQNIEEKREEFKYVITNMPEDSDKPNFKLPKEIYLEKMIEARHGRIKKD